MMRVSLPVVLALFAVACGAGSTATATPHPTTVPLETAAPPTLQPPPPTPTPALPATFTAVVSPTGADVRAEPGAETPRVATLDAGTRATFDGWYRRTDSTALPDAVTGLVEPWSRDWFRLADGRGWVGSAEVVGSQPAGMPQLAWERPAWLDPPSRLVLPVPWRHQERSVTCEVAALQAALQVEGIRVSETQLLDIAGIDRREAVVDDDGTLLAWGDPDDAFVGDPDGHPGDFTGYGVYAAPVARAASVVGGTVLAAGRGITPQQVYAALLGGHPVVAWITVDFMVSPRAVYRSFDGDRVEYLFLEHAVALTGVSPDSVLVTDPARDQSWHSRAEFEAGYDQLHWMAVILE